MFDDPDWWIDIENDAVREACQRLDAQAKDIIGLAACEAMEELVG